MSPSSEGRTFAASGLSDEVQWSLRRLCTSNPFYVISAGLVLVGLWVSFGDPREAEDTWMLMAGLTAYTVLLAGTAFVLIRFARVWDDARTVLLLVVLMFLATSVTFDRVIVFDIVERRWPIRGFSCVLLGLGVAVALSEGILRGVKLKLPACYRVPYYLLVGLFFLYPLALTPFLEERLGPRMMWGLFGFSSAAGAIFLTLLPAVRRGAAAVAKNGSPWPWPLYPWSLFGLFAFAVPGRAILLCYSMHLIDVLDLYDMTFGPYFLVPFGFALTVLLLEAGIVTRRSNVLWAAMTAPLALVVLAWVGHRNELVYVRFLDMFTRQLGGDPVFWTIILGAAFYAYAAVRQVAWACEALTGAVLVLTIVDPRVREVGIVGAPQPIPLIVVASLLLGLGIWRRGSWRCLFGALGLIAGLTMMTAGEVQMAPFRWLLAYHLVILSLLLIAATFDDDLAHAMRILAPAVASLVAVGVLLLPIQPPGGAPHWIMTLYPLAIAIGLTAYGAWLWHPPSMAMSALLLVVWLGAIGWQAYRYCRQIVIGLDYLVLGLLVFPVALAISLAKAGILSRWWTAWQKEADEP